MSSIQGSAHGTRDRPWVVVGLLLVGSLLPVAPTRAQRDAPPDVTDSVILRGKEVYNGPANCAACHGGRGEGTGDGPSLIDDVWLHGSGSYSDIVRQVMHGTPRRQSKTGKPMPMRGWTPIDDEDVRAVAAYVWSLTHRRPNAGR